MSIQQEQSRSPTQKLKLKKLFFPIFLEQKYILCLKPKLFNLLSSLSMEKSKQDIEKIQANLRDWQPLEPSKGGLTLYWANGSIPSMRIFMLMKEKQIQFKSVRLKIMTNPKQTQLPQFLTLNPRGKTPTLVDVISEDQTVVMYESQAILQYLEKRFPNPSLVPSDAIGYSKMAMRQAEADTFNMLQDPLEHIFKKKAARKPYIKSMIKAQNKILAELENLWNEYLATSEYLAGDTFSLADCAFWPVLEYLVHHGLPLKSSPKLSNVLRYYDTINSRKSAEAAQPVGWEAKGRNFFVDLTLELE